MTARSGLDVNEPIGFAFMRCNDMSGVGWIVLQNSRSRRLANRDFVGGEGISGSRA